MELGQRQIIVAQDDRMCRIIIAWTVVEKSDLRSCQLIQKIGLRQLEWRRPAIPDADIWALLDA